MITLFIAISIVDRSFPEKFPRLVNWNVIFTLSSLFIVCRALELSGFFDRISRRILGKGKLCYFSLLASITSLSAVISAIMMNDTALFVSIPFLLSLSKASDVELPLGTVAVAMAVNVGSALSPIGNPQNIYIWQRYSLSFWQIPLTMIPFTLISFGVLLGMLYLRSRKGEVKRAYMPPIKFRPMLFYSSIFLLALDVITAQLKVPWIGLVASGAVIGIVEPEIFLGIDYALVAIFILMLGEFSELSVLLPFGSISWAYSSSFSTIVFSSLLSQGISNVPATIALAWHTSNWRALLVGVNLGGVGWIIGSLANLIALRLSKTSSREFLKFSLPYFAILCLIFYSLSYFGIYPGN